MENLFGAKRKKKVDYEALHSPLNRIPGIDLKTVRDLIDLGISETDELRGRSPQALYEDILNKDEQTPRDRLYAIRMAIYYVESSDPDPDKLQIWKWQDE